MKKSFIISGLAIVVIAVVLVVYSMMPVVTTGQEYFGGYHNTIGVGGESYIEYGRIVLYDNDVGDVIDVTVNPPENYNGSGFEVLGFVLEGIPQNPHTYDDPVIQWEPYWQQFTFHYAPNYPIVTFLFVIGRTATIPDPNPQWSFAYARTSHRSSIEQLPYLISAGALSVVGIVLISLGFLSGRKLTSPPPPQNNK